MLKQYQIKNYNFRLVVYVIALTMLGISIIGSAQKSVQSKQVFGLLLGLLVMAVVSLIDYSFILRFNWLIYIFNIGLLSLITFHVFGSQAKGAGRWIEVAGFRFQPSELSKVLLILFFAWFFGKYHEKINTLPVILISGALIFVPWFMIEEQPDLSTSIVVAVIFIALLFLSGLSYKIIGGVLAVLVPAGSLFIYLILQPNQRILDDYQWRRIMAWLQPEKYATDAYQQQNSIMAIGSGQLWGKGLNNNTAFSVKNGNYIPEPQTDFIFAVAGEELGFVGSIVILLLLLLIVIECILIGRKAKDLSGRLICGGVAVWIGFQTFVNICVVTGLMPNTGLPLPFVSYGLTSLVSLFIGVGLVLNVGLQPLKYRMEGF
ncbi:rod shape-determining protein RodA [Petralouisia muris]|jgi:rod shape determining protein RodA|uniref:Rod shape-determining protein RodA n=1 Tax=Petralouisia muris TaxID=3032872 RepID=A0AC61RY26_9FIRM|nr:FtsW/RodA/SpoVE family cell cycle protein [Petralouisia muris]TGY96722.1 rod shape-determining protein RodA [Petralouisia muris]